MPTFPPVMTGYLYFIATLLGGVMGSFATCTADRIAAGEDFVHGRSHCDTCGHTLGVLDLFPVLSWLFLRGRCRYCGTKIPASCPLTEVGTALVFVLLFHQYGISLKTLSFWLFTVLLLIIAQVDLKIGLIPDQLLLIGFLNFLLTAGLQGGDIWKTIRWGILGGLATAGPLLLLVLLMDRILKRESMGGGDIKLFFVAGCFFPWWCAPFLLIISCILGIAFAMLTKKTTDDPDNPGAFPFGPAIAAGTVLSMFIAIPITALYLSLF